MEKINQSNAAATIAKFEGQLSKVTEQGQSLLMQFCAVLATFKTAEAWEAYGKTFAQQYNAEAGYSLEAAAGQKAWSRWTAKAKAEADVQKPQSEEAKSKAATRKVAEVEALTAALISGVGVEAAEKKLERMKKAEGESATIAKRIEAQCKTAIEQRREAEQAKGNSRKMCEAFALVSALCKLTKEQQARWDEAKAHLAS